MRHVAPTWSLRLDSGRTAHLVATDRSHGDFATSGGRDTTSGLAFARQQLVDAPWAWVTQVHGAEVRVVEAPGDVAGQAADALCTAADNAPLSVKAADCAPVAFVSRSGVVAVAHCGWRGLLAGVVERTVESMQSLGAAEIVAVLGACIAPRAYEFGETDLRRLTEHFGDAVAAKTATGASALDLSALVVAACSQQDVPVVANVGSCTASNPDRYWSHRARGDVERQAMVIWIEQSRSPNEGVEQ